MKKYILYLFAAVLVFSSCQKPGIEISGKLENADNITVKLEYIDGRDFIALDSTKVEENGSYSLNVEIKNTGFYLLKLSNNSFIPLVLDSTATDFTVSGNAMLFPQTYHVSGALESEKLAEANHYITKMSTKIDSLNKLYTTQSNAGATRDMLQPMENQIMGLIKEQSEHINQIVLNNKNSLVALALIDRLSPPDEYISTLKQVSESLGTKYPNLEPVQNLKAWVNNISRLAVGSQAPELALTDTEGNPIRLSNFKGKVVLIDFWASWCGPCRMENPNVVKVYKKYKDKGFEIFGVSLDKSKEAWVQAIKQDGLTWKHGSELAFWNSTFVKTYDVQSIPATYLVDGEGKILAKNLRGASLEEKLQEIFGS